jgi:hypothetical protein
VENVNEQWRQQDADAHEAKAEALAFAALTLQGVTDALEPIEQPVMRNAVTLLTRAQERHEHAAALGRAA